MNDRRNNPIFVFLQINFLWFFLELIIGFFYNVESQNGSFFSGSVGILFFLFVLVSLLILCGGLIAGNNILKSLCILFFEGTFSKKLTALFLVIANVPGMMFISMIAVFFSSVCLAPFIKSGVVAAPALYVWGACMSICVLGNGITLSALFSRFRGECYYSNEKLNYVQSFSLGS